MGCIKDVVLSTGKSASDLLQISPLIATKHENVQEGCKNKCMTSENLCFKGSRCVNHYYTRTCDCFGTKYEGEFCDIYSNSFKLVLTNFNKLVFSCYGANFAWIILRFLQSIRLERQGAFFSH